MTDPIIKGAEEALKLLSDDPIAREEAQLTETEARLQLLEVIARTHAWPETGDQR